MSIYKSDVDTLAAISRIAAAVDSLEENVDGLEGGQASLLAAVDQLEALQTSMYARLDLLFALETSRYQFDQDSAASLLAAFAT